eukprot:Rmarinus@m.22916
MEDLELKELTKRGVFIMLLTFTLRTSDLERIHFDTVRLEGETPKRTICFKIWSSKNHQACWSRRGPVTELPVRFANLCPVRWFSCYRERASELRPPERMLPDVFTKELIDNAPKGPNPARDWKLILTLKPKSGMKCECASAETISRHSKQYLADHGVDIRVYKGNSLRSAGVTAALTNGADLAAVKSHARWNSATTVLENYARAVESTPDSMVACILGLKDRK